MNGHALAATVLLAATGCATSADLGLIQHAVGDRTGGSFDLHAGAGAIEDATAVIDLDVRGDVASGNSRLAFGASALGGVRVGGNVRLLARAELWRAVVSSTAERELVPSFELAAYVPTRESERPATSSGWGSTGLIFGVREDLDDIAYTTLFIGVGAMIEPGQ